MSYPKIKVTGNNKVKQCNVQEQQACKEEEQMHILQRGGGAKCTC